MIEIAWAATIIIVMISGTAFVFTTFATQKYVDQKQKSLLAVLEDIKERLVRIEDKI